MLHNIQVARSTRVLFYMGNESTLIHNSRRIMCKKWFHDYIVLLIYPTTRPSGQERGEEKEPILHVNFIMVIRAGV